MAFCSLCEGMTLPRLVELAKRDFRAGFFSNKDYYHHHASFQELEICAATKKCPLCQVIVDSFENAMHDPLKPTWPVPAVSKAAATADAGLPVTSATPSTPSIPTNNKPAGATMRDVARQLTYSDVRIALRARHVATGAFINSVEMFDLLGVRLGDRLELGDPLRVPDLMLVLRVPGTTAIDYPSLQKSLPMIEGYKIGCATVDNDLASAGNFGMARSWLEDCRHSHDQTTCSTTAYTGSPPRLPTRVIDVSSIPPRIVHAVNVHAGTPEQGCADYVALSHCWGGPIKILLTSKTMDAYSKALPSNKELPANFRDAMAVTRALGISYLWVDSLCIIQDSVDDWQSESRVMGAVYSRATVSLLAMASPASGHGILKKTPKQSVPHCVVPFASDNGPITLQVETIFQNSENLRQLAETAPLSERGWCMQELVFASRILFYGRDQIYWFCPQGGYKSTEAMPDGILFPHDKYPSISSFYYAQDQSNSSREDDSATVERILTDFYHFIESYAQRRLTFGTDKFPAVSSFAQNVHCALGRHSSGFDYMAGVWSGDFRRGLLFCPQRMHAPHVIQANEKDGKYRAPSWSWAVTDSPIMFLAAQTPLTSLPSPLNLQLVSWGSVLRDPKNPFGPVDDAHMVVKGRTCTLRRSAKHFIGAYTWDKDEELGSAWFDNQPHVEGTNDLVDTTNGNCIVFDGGEDTFMCTYYAPGDSTGTKANVSPDIKNSDKQEYKILMVDLGQQDEEKEDAEDDEDDEFGDDDDWDMTERLIHCLILRHIPSPSTNNVYERVGYLILEWKNRKRVDSWKEETLKLV
ncbi:hypothetical protein SBRCBS47491_004582 [Sporothrix bragantina]|uniref:Heterokaryon incompatibility domain-containing protein n=1 Tax=Sporothrix bragantina TaxID=671064 RepID=A0ABP0BPZ4_9PEZI